MQAVYCSNSKLLLVISDHVAWYLEMGVFSSSQKLTKDFSLFALVREMRKQRIAMVQTKEQYILVHQAVKELFLEQLRMIDSHPYENIDCDGCLISSEAPVDPLYDTIESEYYTAQLAIC